MGDDIDLVKSVFEHRLRQVDLDRILTALSHTDRNELLVKMGDLLRRMSALVEVSSKLNDTLALDVLLPRLIDIITDTLGAERSTLFLHDIDTDELYSRVAQGESIGEIRVPAGGGIAGSVFRGGEGEIIADAYADPRFNQEVDRRTGFRTRNILCTPVWHKGRSIGVTQVLNKRESCFDDEDMRLLVALTSQAAAALENAQLYERVEKARREEQQLLEVTSAIASELQIETLLGKVISATTDMLEADRSTLFMHDAEHDQLWSRIAEGLTVKEIRFPANAGIAGACFSGGVVINIPDAYRDERFNREVDRTTGYRTRSILCMPVVNKQGTRLAVIQVLNKRGGPFGSTDEKRLKAFTAQIAIALENARLFEEVLNERNYNESILKSLSNGVLTLDAEQRLIKANESALRLLGWELDEVLEQPIARLLPEPENAWVLDALAKTVASDTVDIAVDTGLRRRAGDMASVNLSTVPLIDVKDRAIGYMLVMEDITREKRVKATMARYMTKEVADKLLESGEDALGGTAQVASVLFSDIRRFTTISEELGARETVSMLNEYFTEMIDVVFSHGGILDKYIGDAIMALFGTPFPGERDADNAVRTANQMMSVLAQLNERRRARNKAAIDIGIGISTGELVAGNIGSPKRMDYTVIGDTVNLAARLESATKYYGVPVLLSDFTVASLVDDWRLREVDLIRVKGRGEAVAVYECLDHYTPDSFPRMQETLAAYAHGLALYRDEDWNRAVGAFEETLACRPGDALARLHLERCRHYLEHPPPPDWGGVWTMAHK